MTAIDKPFINGDARPDAPELAPRGRFSVGVRTLDVINPDQLDIAHHTAGQPPSRYDRPLTLEIWYPAQIPADEEELTTYHDVLGRGPNDPQRPNTPFTFLGRALREAAPDTSAGPYPLVVVSHGYPGSRVLLTNLTENLASKGYVVVAIDHTDSTHGDAGDFAITLFNRPLDQLFVIGKMAELTAAEGFWQGWIDVDNSALIGYSMGGYGALNAAGASYSQAGVGLPWGVPDGLLAMRQAGHPAFEAAREPRLKAVVAVAPWGWPFYYDAAGLAQLTVPSLFIVGDQDGVSGFENVKAMFDAAVHSDRYLLVYQNGRHNVVVNPPPAAAQSNYDDYMHYQEPVWDNQRINNVNQHFLTAFLGIHLQKEPTKYKPYLDLLPIANHSIWSQKPDGSFDTDHTHWHGFKQWTANGLELHHRKPAEK